MCLQIIMACAAYLVGCASVACGWRGGSVVVDCCRMDILMVRNNDPVSSRSICCACMQKQVQLGCEDYGEP